MPTKIALPRRGLAAAAAAANAPAPKTPPLNSHGSAPAAPPVAVAPESSNLWRGVIGIEGTCTGDGRMIDSGALGWQNLPIPIRYAPVDNGGHDGAVVVGRILTLARDGALIIGTGDFDMGSKEGCEAQRQVALGLCNGVSMDLDNIAFEYRVSAEAMGAMDDMWFASQPQDGDKSPTDDYPPVEADIGGPGGTETDADDSADDAAGPDDGRVTVMQFNPDDELEVTTSARIRAATIVALPAFAECKIQIVPAPAPAPGPDSPQATPAPEQDAVTTGPAPVPPPAKAVPVPSDTPVQAHSLAASSIPHCPPAAWFRNPGLDGPTPLAVTEDGRVYGHLATWGTCHTGYADQCVSPPRSAANYAYFRTGALVADDGNEIAVGQLTMDTRHASPEAGGPGAMRHYDHTGTAVADVAAGEDGWGIWVAGALRPGLSAKQVRTLRASPLSGDWRRIGGSLELIAALAVNVPGFPVPRTSGLVASGRLQVLTASGMLAPRKVIAPGSEGAFSDEDLRYLQRAIAREKNEARTLAARQFRQVIGRPVLDRAARLAARLAAAAPPVPAKDDPATKPEDGTEKAEDMAPVSDPALDPQGNQIPDTPKGTPPDPSHGGWLVRGGNWVFDPENDGDDDYTPQGDTDHDYWDVNGKQLKAIPASPSGKQAKKDLPVGQQPPDEKPGTPTGKPAAPAAPPAKSAVRISLAPFARRSFASGYDDSAWDGGAAMSAASKAENPSAAFGAIAFPKKDGNPHSEAHWALPHHAHAGDPPNASGVSAALGRFNQTDDLADPAAAKAHLEAHDKAIQDAKKAKKGS